MTNSFITLAIESAICGGSISLLSDRTEIANCIGTSSVSKAEELLANIDDLLTTNGVRKQDIDMIAVSAGPGSFTGIRIGIATALGMKAGFGIEMSSLPALKAMAFSPSHFRVTAAVPMGRDTVCFQSFQNINGELSALDEPHTMPETAFVSSLQNESDKTFVLHSSLYEKTEPQQNIIDFGANIARVIGLICREQPGVVTEPMFVSKNF